MNAPITRKTRASFSIGAFEPVAKPWGSDGIPEDHAFETLPEDMDHFEPILNDAVKRVPLLETAGIALFFNGPESFTPDDRYYLGEAPEMKNLFVATGLQLDRHPVVGRRRPRAVAVDQERPSAHGRERRRHPPHPSVPVGEAICA